MSNPNTKEREQEFKDFLKDTEGTAYSKGALKWFQQNLCKIVTARELARIPGKSGETINHNMRRVFELRDEQGYEIINWKDKNPLGKPLKVDEWILLKKEANPKMIRSRGVNKRIMYEVFTEKYEEFAKHYHKRSNVETCFAMIKRKFGDFCRCKTERSMVNEILCKALAHNIVCLIHEIFELNLEVDFKGIAKKYPAQKVI